MSVIVPPPTSYTPCPAGLHQAVCCDIVDLGLKETKFGLKHKVRFTWQTDRVNPETGARFDCIRSYTRSMDRRSTLRTHLESWRGRSFSEPELKQGFDLERLIGVNAYLNITHQATADGRIYANVSAIMPPPAGVRIAVVNYTRQQDRPAATATPPVTLPLPNPAAVNAIPPSPPPVVTAAPAAEDADDDDISFAFGANLAPKTETAF